MVDLQFNDKKVVAQSIRDCPFDANIKIIDLNPDTNDEDEVDQLYEESAQMLNILRRGNTVIQVNDNIYRMGRRGFRKFFDFELEGDTIGKAHQPCLEAFK